MLIFLRQGPIHECIYNWQEHEVFLRFQTEHMINNLYFLTWAILSRDERMQEWLEVVVAFRNFLFFKWDLPQDLLHELAAIWGENVDCLCFGGLRFLIWPFEDRSFLDVYFKGWLSLGWWYSDNRLIFRLNFGLNISLSLFLALLNRWLRRSFFSWHFDNHFISHCICFFEEGKSRLAYLFFRHLQTQLQ